MSYQFSQSHTPTSDNHPNPSIHHYSSPILTQPTSNISQLSTNPNNHNSITSSIPTTPNQHADFTFNQLYSCRTTLSSKKPSCKTKHEYFKILYSMYTGCNGNARSRINTLLDHKQSSLSIRSIKTIKKLSTDELMRRYHYLGLKEKGVLVGGTKLFRPYNKSQEEINKLFQSPHFLLPSTEKLYLEFEMEEFLSLHEKELQVTLDEMQQLGSEIMKSDLKKMRLWEAIFLDTKYMRDKLVTLKHTLSRQQIDARNSRQGPLSLFQLAAEKYNDPNWVVHSRIIPDLNEKFRSPIRLVLMPDEEPMTEMAVKNAYTDAKGKMNVAISNWKLSGNGKGNLRAKVKGLAYDNSLNVDDDDTFVDDDRFSFVSQLNIAYFWSLCEMSGLTHHISQNCSALSGNMNESDSMNLSSTSGKVQGRTFSSSGVNHENKKQKIEKQTDALFAMVSDIKKGFLHQSIQFNQSALNSQLLDAEEAVINL